MNLPAQSFLGVAAAAMAGNVPTAEQLSLPASRDPAYAQPMIDLRGGLVRLRPLREEEFDVLWEDRIGDDAFPHLSRPGARERLRIQVERSGRLAEGRLDLGIEAEARAVLVGHIEARAPRGVERGAVFEIGISLFPRERGRGYGSEAVGLLTRYLLDEADGRRVQASTGVENVAMRRVLEKLGFSCERILHDFMPGRDGEREDYVLYARKREQYRDGLR